ncbi:MAG TPA: hypothetical protein VMS21_00705 [Methylomirabilota bacterium]|nr:hypothetical protein [Methylomirabilota bacterium]
MKLPSLSRRQFLATTTLIPLLPAALRAQQEIVIEGTARAEDVIPVALSGFTGVAQSVLRFDLEVVGFEIVPANSARYIIEGNNTASLIRGRVMNAASKQVLVNKGYSGTNERRLAHALANDIVRAIRNLPPIFHTRIAFRVETGRNTSEIYISDFDGHNPQRVTQDGKSVASPCWVPGKQILYYSSYKDGWPVIYAHDLGAGSRTRVASYGGSNLSPAVSPDGRRVAMILSKSGSPDLYLTAADGSGLTPLTRSRADESSPCWSPDGTQVCYVSRESGRPALYVVPAGGGAARRLSTAGAANPTEPSWSPDGKTIMFTSLMGDFLLCTIPAGGGEATILSQAGKRFTGEDSSWAPNSRTVIFTRRAGNQRVLSLLDVPTKRVKDVARQIPGSYSQPSWSR